MLTTRTLRAAALFGVAPGSRMTKPGQHAPRDPAPPIRASKALAAALCLRRGQVALITGPSGSGKSTLLRRLHARAASAVLISPPSAAALKSIPRPIVELPAWRRDSLDSVLRHLARAGLAEASLLTSRPADLSDGQLARLAIAIALRNAERRRAVTTLLIDELGATLDRPTARSLAASLRRAVSSSANLRVIAATSHDDLGLELAPDLTITTRLHAEPTLAWASGASSRANLASAGPVSNAAPPAITDRFAVRDGASADYHALARFHYRAGPPATFAKVLAIDDREAVEPGPIAVLVVSMPTLNGPWRPAAFPELGLITDPRRRARAANRSLRTISRLIVDPRYRGMGLATHLLRTYLAAPITPHTEAVAAMGAVCPIFGAAGMRRVAFDQSARSARLRAVLHRAGLEPHDLLGPARIDPDLEQSIRSWANDSRATRAIARGPIEPLLRAAAFDLSAPRIVYVT